LCFPGNPDEPTEALSPKDDEKEFSEPGLARVKSEALDPEISAIYSNNMETFLQEGHLGKLISLLDSDHRSITLQIIQIVSLFTKESMLEKLQMNLLSENLAINKVCELMKDGREIVRNGKR
jgi:Mg2+/Co2+ transporter CorC